MIRFGATGLGATPGNASSGLVKTFVKPVVQFPLAVLAVHAQISNFRSALKRFCPDCSIALACTRLIRCAPPPSWTVTCLPATGGVVEDHCVPSVSSIRLPRSDPSPVVVAPFADEAQFFASWNVTVPVWPAVKVFINRVKP